MQQEFLYASSVPNPSSCMKMNFLAPIRAHKIDRLLTIVLEKCSILRRISFHEINTVSYNSIGKYSILKRISFN